METTTHIRALLRAIAGSDRERDDFHLLEVVSVEGEECRARLGELEIPGVRLAAVGGGNGSGAGAKNSLLLTPAPGSVILVADRSRGSLRELHAVGYSEIASVRYRQGKTTLEADAEGATLTVGGSRIRITDEGIQFNDGAHAGLVKAAELRRSLESLRRYCEQLRTAVAAGFAAVGAGATANGGTGAAAFNEAMAAAAIRIEELENEKVTH